MKRILYLFVLLAALVAAGCQKTLVQFSVTPVSLEFNGEAGTQTLTVTAGDTWALKVDESAASWLTTSRIYGQSSTTVDVSVTANAPAPRSAEIVFSCSGQSVKVTVTQAAGNAEVEVEKGEFYPDPASGIEIDPVCPDADAPAIIVFKPAADNPLYGHSGELYGHLGVVVEGEWMYVQGEWGQPTEKTHFTKIADNHWELKLEPTVREYFESGDTPITQLAIIVRSEDGSIKSHDEDQFCSAVDNQFKPVPFEPHPLVTAELPAGAKHGINYNADGTMTFVFYDQDTAKKSHKYCYIVGDWNNWERVAEGAMKWDPTAGCWWITLGDFDADKE